MVVEINSQQDDEEFEQNNNYTQQYGCHARLKTQDTAVNVVKVFGEFEFSMQHLSRVHTDFFFFFFFRRVATINRLIILPLFSACWVFLCFRKTPNSDTDYRTFLTCIRDHSYAWVYTQGLGTHWQQVTTFFTQKTSKKKLLCPWRGSNCGLSGHGIWSPTLC